RRHMRRCWRLLALGVAVALAGRTVSAEDAAPDPNAPTQVKLVLHAQAVPSAALKYELLPPFLDTTPGNAAPLWYRAILHMKAQLKPQDPQVLYDLLEVESTNFAVETVKPILGRFHTTLDAMEAAARRGHCDWDLPLRSDNPTAVLLPEMQDARTLAYLIALQTRVQVHEGQYDEAIHSLQTGFALGRDVNQCPLIICNLIAVAIDQILANRIEEMLQRPDAPNLYWALTALPESLAPIDRAVHYEMSIPYQLFPFLRNPAETDRPDAEWQKLWDEAAVRLSRDVSNRPTNPWEMRLMMAANSVRLYPKAKELLKARGYSSAQIESMPVGQALAIYSAEIIEAARGESFKWANIPLWQQQQEDHLPELPPQRVEVLPIVSTLLPVVRQFQFASQRLNRRMAELRALEALRAAAARQGALPDNLALTATPVPHNPCTGGPFGYVRNKDHATLTADEAPGSRRSNLARVYQITLQPVP
ncbi:MAG TPA: hypothetical protein VHB77_11385, partial [Planctomycetaceae bacterium]|nr:hypothetical protein [Planctomycetaceae bacterium]